METDFLTPLKLHLESLGFEDVRLQDDEGFINNKPYIVLSVSENLNNWEGLANCDCTLNVTLTAKGNALKNDLFEALNSWQWSQGVEYFRLMDFEEGVNNEDFTLTFTARVVTTN